jgi:hypothetical protein
MYCGMMIENTVIGGPAYSSGQLQHGDLILMVDGMAATQARLPCAFTIPAASRIIFFLAGRQTLPSFSLEMTFLELVCPSMLLREVLR